jgi:hypothetical protein
MTIRLAIKSGDPLPALHRLSLLDLVKKAWTRATPEEREAGLAFYLPGAREEDLREVGTYLCCF